MRPLIVEGPDGAGKTTLLKKLSHDLGRPVVHTGGPPANKAALEAKLVLMDNNPTAFFDRCPHISDPIYARMAGRPMFLPRGELLDHLDRLNPVIVYCRRRMLRDMWESIDKNKKDHKSPEHLAQVLQNYKDIVKEYDDFFMGRHSRYVFFGYDWGTDSYSDLLRRIKPCVD